MGGSIIRIGGLLGVASRGGQGQRGHHHQADGVRWQREALGTRAEGVGRDLDLMSGVICCDNNTIERGGQDAVRAQQDQAGAREVQGYRISSLDHLVSAPLDPVVFLSLSLSDDDGGV